MHCRIAVTGNGPGRRKEAISLVWEQGVLAPSAQTRALLQAATDRTISCSGWVCSASGTASDLSPPRLVDRDDAQASARLSRVWRPLAGTASLLRMCLT